MTPFGLPWAARLHRDAFERVTGGAQLLPPWSDDVGRGRARASSSGAGSVVAARGDRAEQHARHHGYAVTWADG